MQPFLAPGARTARHALLAVSCASLLSVAIPARELSAQNATLVIGTAADAFPAGPFGKAADASVAMGQTFMRPAGAVCQFTCYLQSFSFWLGTSQGLATNPADLRFQAYVANWDEINGMASTVRFASGVLSGPVGPSQRFTVVAPNVAIDFGTRYVAFLSVVGLSGLMPATATSDFDLVDGTVYPYADGAWVFTNNGSSIGDLMSTPWDFAGDPSLQSRFEAQFSTNVVPEPSSLALLAGGGIALLVVARRRRI